MYVVHGRFLLDLLFSLLFAQDGLAFQESLTIDIILGSDGIQAGQIYPYGILWDNRPINVSVN